MDIFAHSPSFWSSDPDVAISSWLAHRGLSKSSSKVYESMLRKFSRWMHGRGKTFPDASTDDVIDFFVENGIHKEHRRRYARLIEMAFDDLMEHGLERPENPGRIVAFLGETKGKNDHAAFLSREDKDRLIVYLREQTGRIENQEELIPFGPIALALGAGAKTGEILRLRVGNVGKLVNCDKASVRMPDGRVPPVDDYAGEIISRIVMGRAPEERLIPGGGAQGAPNKSTFLRWTRRILAEAGIEMERRSCLQTLRNTYLASLFDRGLCDEAVMAFSGIKSARGFALFKAEYAAFRRIP